MSVVAPNMYSALILTMGGDLLKHLYRHTSIGEHVDFRGADKNS